MSTCPTEHMIPNSRYTHILGSCAPTSSQLRYLRMFAVAVWHWVGFLLGQCVRDQVRTIAATGLRTASIELRAIAMLAHCASTRSALHLAACTQRDNSTMGLAPAPAGTGGAGYRRHRPEDTVLYGVVEQHADAFFEGQVEQGRALPRFVREEFEAYLRCGRFRGLYACCLRRSPSG